MPGSSSSLAPQIEPAAEAAVSGTPLAASEEQEKDDHAGAHMNDMIPTIPSEQIKRTSIFKYFEEQYKKLDDETKQLLSCVLVFPDDFVIRKTALRYWWMAKDLTDKTRVAEEKKIAELDKLIEMDIIEPVMEERRTLENKFIRMNPFIRFIFITLTEKENNPDFDSVQKSLEDSFLAARKVLLLSTNQKSSQYGLWNQDPTNIETIFNVNQSLIDLQSIWLSKAKSLRVLQLGCWEGSSNNHIEVASAEFLKSFVNLKSLRYLGLNRISGIHKLPPSVSSLGDLRILDLKACANLTKIPAEIRNLTKLTHLDMSECYLIESMPKELVHLKHLVVLKGFMVGDPQREDACKIVDLTNLKELRKLGVYCSMEADAGEATQLEGLSEFEALRSLTIAWIEIPRPSSSNKKDEVHTLSKPSKGKHHSGNCFPRLVSRHREIGAKGNRVNEMPSSVLPEKLKKLDLRCYPTSSLPIWVNSGSLEKLYIRGGQLCCLKEFRTVKTLRLRYLTELEMDWKELTSLFPDLQFLEKVRCPKLSLFPCNGYGEWKRHTEH